MVPAERVWKVAGTTFATTNELVIRTTAEGTQGLASGARDAVHFSLISPPSCSERLESHPRSVLTKAASDDACPGRVTPVPRHRPCCRGCSVRPGCPPDPVAGLLRLPRAGRGEAEGQPAPRHRGRGDP